MMMFIIVKINYTKKKIDIQFRRFLLVPENEWTRTWNNNKNIVSVTTFRQISRPINFVAFNFDLYIIFPLV